MNGRWKEAGGTAAESVGGRVDGRAGCGAGLVGLGGGCGVAGG